MLDDLAHVVPPAQFIGRLNDKRFENALPAEAELALVWAANRLGGFEAEPQWYSPTGRLPEGISSALIPGRETVFDVPRHAPRSGAVSGRQRRQGRKPASWAAAAVG